MPDAPPSASYAMAVTELRVGSLTVLGAGSPGIVVSGERIPVSDLADQFRGELLRLATITTTALEVGIRLLEPRVETSGDGHVEVTAPAVEARVLALGDIAGAATLRLAVASASVTDGVVERPGLAPPASGAPEEGLGTGARQSPAQSSPGEPAGTGPPAGTGDSAAPAPERSSPTGPFARRPRARTSGGFPTSGPQRTMIVMGVAALNAVLVVGRAAYLLAKSREPQGR